jgi:hypothetical protein
MRSTLQKILANSLPIGVVVFFLCAAILGYHIHVSTERFDHAYRNYAVAAGAADAAAYLPAAGNNPVRQDLNNVLIQALGNSKLSDQERLEHARDGLELVGQLDKQVDAITHGLEAADIAAQEMNASSDILSNIFAKGLPQKIVGLAHRRHDAISDIRAYSYRADSQARQIFERIAQENGVLSQNYIRELNNLVPAQEEEFNQRTNRYSDLQAIGLEIDTAFGEFVRRFEPNHR